MVKFSNRPIRALNLTLALGLFVLAIGGATPASAEFIALRSGNAPIGNPDPQINMLVGAGGTPLSANPFTAAEFGAACTGHPAMVIPAHPAWLQQLPCDPLALWIGTDPVGTPASALYCHTFDVQTCCIKSATLDFCWSSDDALGDGIYGGPNLDGVYINGVAVTPSINTGSYAVPTQTGPIDVTALLHCGSNQLQVYNRDAAFVVSGVIYSATIDISECSVPTEAESFGSIKTLYR
jgi:hypothetical protein